MKIERLNENQIRCTLTREDLQGREIRLSELAYGSEKARRLFHDMMEEARHTVGFDTENSPLMIEAIPLAPDSLSLIITRVDDPEELDTRFARFTRSDNAPVQAGIAALPGADDVLELFNKLFEAKNPASEEAASGDAAPAEPQGAEHTDAGISDPGAPAINLTQAFRFRTLDDVIEAARSTAACFDGENTLYRTPDEDGSLHLVIRQSGMTAEAFNRFCNMLSEFGSGEVFSPARAAWLDEHGCVLVRSRALQQLRDL